MSLKCARFLTTFFSHLPHHDRFLQIRSGFNTKHFVCTMLKNNLPTIVASDESAILRHVRNLVNFKEKEKKRINKILFASQYKTQFQYPSSITAIIIIKPINLTHSYAFKCLKTFCIYTYSSRYSCSIYICLTDIIEMVKQIDSSIYWQSIDSLL